MQRNKAYPVGRGETEKVLLKFIHDGDTKSKPKRSVNHAW